MTGAEELLIIEGLRALPQLVATVLELIRAARRGDTVAIRIERPRPLSVDDVLDQAEAELGVSPIARTEPPPAPDTDRTPEV